MRRYNGADVDAVIVLKSVAGGGDLDGRGSGDVGDAAQSGNSVVERERGDEACANGQSVIEIRLVSAEVEAAIFGEEEADVGAREDGAGRGADEAVDAVVGERCGVKSAVHVSPGGAAVDGLEEARGFGHAAGFEEIAGPGIHDIRIAGVHANRANGAAGEEIGEWLPGCAVIGRLPYAAVGGGDVHGEVVAARGVDGDVHHDAGVGTDSLKDLVPANQQGRGANLAPHSRAREGQPLGILDAVAP